ncbi:hypothetical protein BDL97_19G025800 [Sphagnum fallax]|nr:hypothetical protein BDL97_19G025800 [Sphagnum fallax]
MNWPLQCSSALLFSPYPNTMHTPPSFPSNKKQTLCTSIALTILLRTSSSKNACCQCDHPLFQLQAQSWAFTTKTTQQQQSCQLPSCALQQLHPDTNSIQSNKNKKTFTKRWELLISACAHYLCCGCKGRNSCNTRLWEHDSFHSNSNIVSFVCSCRLMSIFFWVVVSLIQSLAPGSRLTSPSLNGFWLDLVFYTQEEYCGPPT